MRIKYLYAFDNRINSVAGSLQRFKFLRVLNLSNNNIKDLNSVLRLLEKNQYLEELCKSLRVLSYSPSHITNQCIDIVNSLADVFSVLFYIYPLPSIH